MKLKTLLKNIPAIDIRGSKEIEITGITAHSQQVSPGELFLVRKGTKLEFIQEAVAAGAVALLTDLYNPFLSSVTQIICPCIEEIEFDLLSQFYGFPLEKLKIAGVTGTNGKTTTSYLMKHLLDQLEGPCGLIGTIEWIVGEKKLGSTHTTPDRVTLMRLLSEMVAQGCKSVAMEVSSHALEQKRVEGILFDYALFTNLTQDHLDYHHTMEQYAAAKGKLFGMLSEEGVAIYNKDSPWSEKVLERCTKPKLSYGFGQGADLWVEELRMSPHGMQFKARYEGQEAIFVTPLVGRFNVYNLLAATGVGLVRQVPLREIASIFSSFTAVPGRLERVENEKKLTIFVDYAHTDDALKNVLETLHEFKKGKIITVFGCGGDRDALKRPKMAKAAAHFSDLVIVTSDNPRSESPEVITRHILAGFEKEKKYAVELDRKKAIEKAVQLATPQDIVLIAGKGHEKYQLIGHQKIPFDDYSVAQQACRC